MLLANLPESAERALAERMSYAPARIGRLDGYASPFAVGNTANFTLYDPGVRRPFSREQLHGKGVNSPYLSTELPGQVIATIHDGYATVLDGALVDPGEVAEHARSRRG